MNILIPANSARIIPTIEGVVSYLNEEDENSRSFSHVPKLRDFDFPISNISICRNFPQNLKGRSFGSINYLTSGSNSIVFTGKQNGETLVIKMLQQYLRKKTLAYLEMNLEMQILCRLQHPNIIEIRGCGESPRKFIVVEYLQGGTLSDLLCTNNRKHLQSTSPPQQQQQQQHNHHHAAPVGLSLEKVLTFAHSIASALKYLHQELHADAVVIHRDLKPQNIGFTSDGQLKLFDFGLVSCIRRDSSAGDSYKLSGRTGTLPYMAPEVALCNEKVDIYALGIIIWQMMTGASPYPLMTQLDYMEHVAEGGLRPSLEEVRCKAPAVVELLEMCWHADPTQRPSADRVVEILAGMKESLLGVISVVANSSTAAVSMMREFVCHYPRSVMNAAKKLSDAMFQTDRRGSGDTSSIENDSEVEDSEEYPDTSIDSPHLKVKPSPMQRPKPLQTIISENLDRV